MLFLDWEKAFDKISHEGLHSALHSFGLDSIVCGRAAGTVASG